VHRPMRHAQNPHGVASGWLGGKKGGPARAAKLTAEQRREGARKAGQERGTARRLSLERAIPKSAYNLLNDAAHLSLHSIAFRPQPQLYAVRRWARR